MQKLYSDHETQVDDIIFEHFADLDRNIFEIKYYSKFPSLQRLASAKKRSMFTKEQRISMTLDDNMLRKSRNLLEYGDDEEEQKYVNEISDEEEEEEDTDEWEQRQLQRHRSQFRKAMKIVGKERETGRTDYNRLVFLLQENNIDYNIIDDVLKFGAKAGLFDKKDDSDIDNSDESERAGYASSAGGKIEMMRTEYANRNRSSTRAGDSDIVSSDYED